MNNVIILGKNSFIAKKLSYILGSSCKLLSRNEIDFLIPGTFSNIDFNDTVIIDCINVNNGNEAEIIASNFIGFTNFCKYLVENKIKIKYIYISTISTISDVSVKSSVYIRSKKLAEDYLLNSGLDCQIIRLSYPFGIGENKQRLLSRIIKSLKENREIKINDVKINLNYVDDVCINIVNRLLTKKIIFISNNHYSSLYDYVMYLKKAIQSKSNVEKIVSTFNFMPLTDLPFKQARSNYDILLEML